MFYKVYLRSVMAFPMRNKQSSVSVNQKVEMFHMAVPFISEYREFMEFMWDFRQTVKMVKM